MSIKEFLQVCLMLFITFVQVFISFLLGFFQVVFIESIAKLFLDADLWNQQSSIKFTLKTCSSITKGKDQIPKLESLITTKQEEWCWD